MLIFVDDPRAVVRGTSETRRRLVAALILFWLDLGLGLFFSNGQPGQKVVCQDPRGRDFAGKAPWRRPLSEPMTIVKVTGNKVDVASAKGDILKDLHVERSKIQKFLFGLFPYPRRKSAS